MSSYPNFLSYFDYQDDPEMAKIHFQSLYKSAVKFDGNNLSEIQLQMKFVSYMRQRYPDVILSHYSNANLPMKSINKMVQTKAAGGLRGLPDIQIFEPRKGLSGLFLEFKRENTKLFKKNGEPASEHVKIQIELIEKLKRKNYAAHFVFSIKEAIDITNNYLNE